MKLRTSPSSPRQPAWPRACHLARAIASAVLCTALVLPAAQAQSPNAARFRGPDVTLNFVEAEIEGVTRAMGAILNEQFVVDPRVRGTMTLYSEEPLSPREAYRHYLAALRGLGFTVVESGGLLKVVPEADAKLQASTVTVGPTAVRGDQVITQIFQLNHENATSLVPVLRPLISPNNTINANPGNNTLVITDYADNLRRLAKIISAMDTPGSGNVEVIALQHAVASDVAALVQRLTDSPVTGPGAPSGSQPTAPGAAGAGTSTSVLVDPRSNALIVRAPNAARLAMIRSTIAKLDQPLPGGSGNIWVVYLKNADATRLATVLRAAFSTDAGQQAPGSGQIGSAGGTTPAATGMAGGDSSAATTPVSAAAAPSTGGFIQADPATNSLVITAAEPLYRRLRSVIDKLDSRRAQVYVETMIVEVNATKAADVGFQWQGLLGNSGDRTGLIGGTNFGSGGNNIINLSLGAATLSSGGASGTAPVLPAAGLNIGLVRNFAGTYTLAALARFLETNADGNILSTPNLVTLDNEEAKITIGQNVPFVTGQYTNAASGGVGGAINPFQTIERKDVGITLRVRPQVGEDGTVRMQIYQEVSSVVNQNVSQGVADATAGLVTNKRSIESSVVVDDGQILVLGGLMQDQFQNNRDKVPLLGDAPVFGGLFRSENRTRTKTNLMVFLRPVVMRTPQSSADLTLDRYDVIRAQQQESQPQLRRLLPINEAPVLPALRPPPEQVPVPQQPSGTITTPVKPTPPPEPTSPPAPVPQPLPGD